MSPRGLQDKPAAIGQKLDRPQQLGSAKPSPRALTIAHSRTIKSCRPAKARVEGKPGPISPVAEAFEFSNFLFLHTVVERKNTRCLSSKGRRSGFNSTSQRTHLDEMGGVILPDSMLLYTWTSPHSSTNLLRLQAKAKTKKDYMSFTPWMDSLSLLHALT